jgi:hypothetical protein
MVFGLFKYIYLTFVMNITNKNKIYIKNTLLNKISLYLPIVLQFMKKLTVYTLLFKLNQFKFYYNCDLFFIWQGFQELPIWNRK